MTAGDIGFVIVVNVAPYLMNTGTAVLNLQRIINPRAAHLRLPLLIQTSTYTDPLGNVYAPYTAAIYVTTGAEFGSPPAGGVYVASLQVLPAGGNSFTSPLGSFTVNSIMAP
jgi:hypothetical protein